MYLVIFAGIVVILLILLLMSSDCINNTVLAYFPSSNDNMSCLPGQMVTDIGCKICPENTYSTEFNAKDCLTCPTGFKSYPMNDECFCPKGSYLNGNSCVLCQANTYSDIRNAKECQLCPTGYVSEMGSVLCKPL